MSGIAVAHRESMASDGVLVQEAAAGSGTSYGQLYDRYAEQVYNYCLRVTGSPDDAADATQEAFVNVLRRLHDDDRPVLEFSSYLFAAARNESYALMKRRARVEPSETLPEQPATVDVETEPERAAILHDSQEAVRQANSTLAPRHREVLALRELGDHSYDEIGRIMGISENSAAQLIWRARSKLRDAMTAGAVASVVPTSTDCERAQVLLTRIQDGEPVDELDRFWLDRHLDECGSCRAARGMLLEVAAFYCAWIPVAAAAAMKTETLTAAGSLVGADWSGVASGSSAGGAGGAGGAGAGAGGAGVGAGGVGAGGAVAGVATLAAVGLALSAVLGGGGTELERKATEPERSTSAPVPAEASKSRAGARDAPLKISSLGAGLPGARAPLGALSQDTSPGAGSPPADTPGPNGQGRGDPRSDPPGTGSPGTDSPQNPATPGPRSGPGEEPRGGGPGEGPGGGSPGGDQPPGNPGNPGPSPDPREPPVDTTPPDPPPDPPREEPPPPPQSDGCTWPGGGGGPGGCPPGHGGTPPGQGGTPPGQGGKPPRRGKP